MNDQYRISDAPPPEPATAPAPAPQKAPAIAPAPQKAQSSHYKLVSTALWVGLLAGALLNSGLQLAGAPLLAVPFGVVAACCGIALIVRAVQGRRRA